MSVKTVISLPSLEAINPIEWETFPVSKKALLHYFSTGGILRVALSQEKSDKSKVPEKKLILLYPTRMRLKQLIKEKEGLKGNYSKKHSFWNKEYDNAVQYNLSKNVKKFTNPLYWKHMSKYLVDKDYKKKADAIKLPISLVSDPRWQPMIRTFIENPDYRHQLTETVEKSIVYKGDRRVAKYAEKLQEFREGESSKNLKTLNGKLTELEMDISAMQELLKWTSQ